MLSAWNFTQRCFASVEKELFCIFTESKCFFSVLNYFYLYQGLNVVFHLHGSVIWNLSACYGCTTRLTEDRNVWMQIGALERNGIEQTVYRGLLNYCADFFVVVFCFVTIQVSWDETLLAFLWCIYFYTINKIPPNNRNFKPTCNKALGKPAEYRTYFARALAVWKKKKSNEALLNVRQLCCCYIVWSVIWKHFFS